MSVLSAKKIEGLLKNDPPIIEDAAAEMLQGASYDLRMGGEFYAGTKDSDGVTPLDDHELLCIPANGICFVITHETLHLPDDVAGQLSLAFGLILRGIMLSAQPPLDPGYHGKIIALLHNLSDAPVYIEKCQHVLTVAFFSIDGGSTKPYDGSHQNLNSLKASLKRPPVGAVWRLRTDFGKLKRSVERYNQIAIVAITVIVAVLTIIVGWQALGLGSGGRVESAKPTESVYPLVVVPGGGSVPSTLVVQPMQSTEASSR